MSETPSNELKQILDEIEEKRRNAWRYTDSQPAEDFILYEAAALVKALRSAIEWAEGELSTPIESNAFHSQLTAIRNQG